MVNAYKRTVIVQSGGRIEFVAPELVEGSEAEVIVLVENGGPEVPDEEELDDIHAYLDAKAEMAATGERAVPLEQVLADIAAQRTLEK